MRKLMGYDLEDVLELAGLRRRRPLLLDLLPALGLLATGAAIGAGIGLAFAPSSGRRFRQDMSGRFDQLRQQANRVREGTGDAKYQANANSSQS